MLWSVLFYLKFLTDDQQETPVPRPPMPPFADPRFPGKPGPTSQPQRFPGPPGPHDQQPWPPARFPYDPATGQRLPGPADPRFAGPYPPGPPGPAGQMPPQVPGPSYPTGKNFTVHDLIINILNYHFGLEKIAPIQTIFAVSNTFSKPSFGL